MIHLLLPASLCIKLIDPIILRELIQHLPAEGVLLCLKGQRAKSRAMSVQMETRIWGATGRVRIGRLGKAGKGGSASACGRRLPLPERNQKN
jgi:hypothetical protein